MKMLSRKLRRTARIAERMNLTWQGATTREAGMPVRCRQRRPCGRRLVTSFPVLSRRRRPEVSVFTTVEHRRGRRTTEASVRRHTTSAQTTCNADDTLFGNHRRKSVPISDTCDILSTACY